MMKLFLLLIFIPSACAAQSVSLAVNNAQHHKKSQLLLAMIGKETDQMHQMEPLIKNALEFKKQCEVVITHMPALIKKNEAIAYKQKGFDYIIFVHSHADHID